MNSSLMVSAVLPLLFVLLLSSVFVSSQSISMTLYCGSLTCGGTTITTLPFTVGQCGPLQICSIPGSVMITGSSPFSAQIFLGSGCTGAPIISSNPSYAQCVPMSFLAASFSLSGAACESTTATTTTTTTTTTGSTSTSTTGGPISPKLDEDCYNLTTSVSKELQGTPQYFTLQDLGCSTTNWNIVNVNTTTLYSYQDPNQIKLVIQPSLSGVRPVHYQIMSSDNQYIHTVKTKIDIINHKPVINNATFTWHYPRTTTTFPNWNILSNCTDQDGDRLSVVKIEKTAARAASSIIQLNDTVLHFIPEKVVLSVLPTGEISMTAPSNSNPVTAGSPLALFWKQSISFQFQITDGDVTNEHAWGTANINYWV